MKYFLLIFFSFSYLYGSSQDLNLGLKAYYPFTGNANDISGNNANPAFNNATLSADAAGNPNSAYRFNGSNSYMRIANTASINTTNQISLCVMVHPLAFYQGTCHGNSVMFKGVADFQTGNYIIRFDDAAYTNAGHCANPVVDEVHQNFYGNSSLMPVYSPYIQPNDWYSVVYTYDGTTAKLYINCELKRSTAVAGMTFTNAADLYFGRTPIGAYPYWFNGDLDEIRIYDRALTAAEVVLYGACKVTAADFMDFNVSTGNKSVFVDWSATNEETGHYLVERAENGSNDFTSIYQQTMEGGPSTHRYSYIDKTVLRGKTYQYRIRSVENGTSKLSAIKIASLAGKISQMSVSPNPSKGLFRVYVENGSGKAAVTLYNMNAEQIFSDDQKDISRPFVMDLGKYSPGVYIIKIRTANEVYTDKLIVQ